MRGRQPARRRMLELGERRHWDRGPSARSDAAAVATILFVFCLDRQRCSADERENETPPRRRQGFGGLAPLPATPGVAENEPIVPTDRLHSSTPGRSSQGGTLGAYLELLRPPNVTTAVGDVLAGLCRRRAWAARGLCPGCLRPPSASMPAGSSSTTCSTSRSIASNGRNGRSRAAGSPVSAPRSSARRSSRPGVAFAAAGRPAAGIVARRDGGVHPPVRCVGQTPDMGGPRQHGAVPRRQPDARVSRRRRRRSGGPGRSACCRWSTSRR